MIDLKTAMTQGAPMTIDPKAIRVGDEVTVRMVVVEVDPQRGSPYKVRASSFSYQDVWLIPEDITTHTPKPRPLEVGMRVRDIHDKLTGKIICIFGNEAWLNVGTDESPAGLTKRLAYLEPAE